MRRAQRCEFDAQHVYRVQADFATERPLAQLAPSDREAAAVTLGAVLAAVAFPSSQQPASLDTECVWCAATDAELAAGEGCAGGWADVAANDALGVFGEAFGSIPGGYGDTIPGSGYGGYGNGWAPSSSPAVATCVARVVGLADYALADVALLGGDGAKAVIEAALGSAVEAGLGNGELEALLGGASVLAVRVAPTSGITEAEEDPEAPRAAVNLALRMGDVPWSIVGGSPAFEANISVAVASATAIAAGVEVGGVYVTLSEAASSDDSSPPPPAGTAETGPEETAASPPPEVDAAQQQSPPPSEDARTGTRRALLQQTPPSPTTPMPGVVANVTALLGAGDCERASLVAALEGEAYAAQIGAALTALASATGAQLTIAPPAVSGVRVLCGQAAIDRLLAAAAPELERLAASFTLVFALDYDTLVADASAAQRFREGVAASVAAAAGVEVAAVSVTLFAGSVRADVTVALPLGDDGSALRALAESEALGAAVLAEVQWAAAFSTAEDGQLAAPSLEGLDFAAVDAGSTGKDDLLTQWWLWTAVGGGVLLIGALAVLVRRRGRATRGGRGKSMAPDLNGLVVKGTFGGDTPRDPRAPESEEIVNPLMTSLAMADNGAGQREASNTIEWTAPPAGGIERWEDDDEADLPDFSDVSASAMVDQMAAGGGFVSPNPAFGGNASRERQGTVWSFNSPYDQAA